MTKSELLTLIENNFFYPKKFSKTELCEDYQEALGDGYEGNSVANFFNGKTNKDIKIESLLDEYPADYTACLHFMTPTAASYFIGSFMHMAILNDLYGQDLRFTLMTIFDRRLNGDEKSEAWFVNFLVSFNEKQRLTIYLFIDYLEKNYMKEVSVIDFKKAKGNFLEIDMKGSIR